MLAPLARAPLFEHPQPPLDPAVRSAGAFVTDVSPIPFTARSVQRTMVGDGSDKFLWSERMMGLFGPQAQHVPPEGLRMTKRGLVPARSRENQSIWDEIVTGRR